jgi:hypothetical protein
MVINPPESGCSTATHEVETSSIWSRLFRGDRDWVTCERFRTVKKPGSGMGISSTVADTIECFHGSRIGAGARSLFSLVFAGALAACSIHPTQEDVTRVPTKHIVDRIRCEARLAIVDKAIDLLRQKAEAWERDAALPENMRSAAKFRKDAQRLRDIADGLVPRRRGPVFFRPEILPPGEPISFYNRYINTVIAYDFMFNITEDNKVAAAADPLRAITGGVVGGGLSGSSELTRNNVRTFKLSDTFGELLDNRDLDCASDYLPGNYVYPITGSIGLRDIVHNFIDLNEDRPLVAAASGASAFADALEFTTEVIGTAAPHVQIDPVGNRLGLGSPTGFTLMAQRKDIHKVTIGLATGTAGHASSFIGPRGLLVPVQPVAGESASAAGNRARAFKAIEDQRFNTFLDRAGALFR